MPAKSKYLSSTTDRALKIFSGLVLGYVITALLHLCLGAIIHKATIAATSIYSLFIIWMLFFILPFLSKKGLKPFLFYLLASAILALLYFVIR